MQGKPTPAISVELLEMPRPRKGEVGLRHIDDFYTISRKSKYPLGIGTADCAEFIGSQIAATLN